MSISAKELAKKLNITPAAVSMALNGKPGVSTKTRKIVMEAAQQYGYDFSKHTPKKSGTIAFIIFRRQGAVVQETMFFSQLSEGIENGCKKAGQKLQIYYLYNGDEMEDQISNIIYSGCNGVILLGTEMTQQDYNEFKKIPLPMVILDSYLDYVGHDCVQINNVQGAFRATDYLISKTKKQPGYLHSSYNISNFEERADGFYKAVRHHGMSTSKSIVHKLSPSVEGALADMLEIIESGEELASCYFADNDLIAIGAMKAFSLKGYRIPADIGIIGFDDINSASYVEPALTTIHVPKQYMGEMAIKRLLEIIDDNGNISNIKIEIATRLIKRKSV